MTDSVQDRALRSLDALAAGGWTVARDRSQLLEIDDDAYPMIAVDQRSFDEPFGEDGELAEDLRFVRHGPAADIQVAFAQERMCIAVNPDDEEEDFSLEGDRLSIGTDLIKLLDILDGLRAVGFAIGAAYGDTPTDAWEQVDSEAGGRASNAVLWTREAHRAAFNRVGKLEGSLSLGWRGDRSKISEAFVDTVFEVQEPVDEGDTFVITT